MTNTPLQDIQALQADVAIFDAWLNGDADTLVTFGDGSERPTLAKFMASLGGGQAAAGGAVAAVQLGNVGAFTYNNGANGVGATLTANANGLFPSAAIDGVNPAVNMRIWITGGGAPDAGIYYFTAIGDGTHPWVLTRATDADSADELGFIFAYVTGGATQKGLIYQIPLASTSIVVGTTPLPSVVIGHDPYVPEFVNASANITAGVADDRGVFYLTPAAAMTFSLDPTAMAAGWSCEVFVDSNPSYEVEFLPLHSATLDGQASRYGMARTRVKIKFDGANFQTAAGSYTYQSAPSAWVAGTTVAFNHNLGASSIDIQDVKVQLVCIAGDNGWPANKVVDITGQMSGAGNTISPNANSTTLYIGAAGFSLPKHDLSASFSPSPANWNIQITARAS